MTSNGSVSVVRKAVMSVEFVVLTRKVITLTREQVRERMDALEWDKGGVQTPIDEIKLDKVMRILKREARTEIEDDGEDDDYEEGNSYDIESIIDSAVDDVERDKIVKDTPPKTE